MKNTLNILFAIVSAVLLVSCTEGDSDAQKTSPALGAVTASPAGAQQQETKADDPRMAGFNGKIGRTFAESVSDDKKSATVTLSVNGKEVGSGVVGRTVPGTYSLSETFDVGQDTGTSVSKDYDRDNLFTGTLDKVVFNLE